MPALGAITNRSKSIRNLQSKRRQKTRTQKPQDHKHDEFEINLSEGPFRSQGHNGQTLLGKFLQFIDPFIILLIAVNAIMMGIGTFDFVADDEHLSQTFEKIDKIFLIIFSVEVSLNIFHFIRLDRLTFKAGTLVLPPQEEDERRERASNKSWLVFDALVVIMSWAFASVSIIRAFRILRALRLIAKIKSMRSVILALTRVMPKMVMVGFLLIIIFLVFGIMFTELFRDLYKNGYTEFDYYGRIDLTLLTLFQIMTFDNFGEMAREVMDKYPLAWIPLILFAVITGFVIVNLIIAIICESLAGMDATGVDALHGASDLLQSIHTRDDFPKSSIVPSASNFRSNTSLRSSLKTTTSSDLFDGNLSEINDSLEEILEYQEELGNTVLELKALVLKLKSELAQKDGSRSYDK